MTLRATLVLFLACSTAFAFQEKAKTKSPDPSARQMDKKQPEGKQTAAPQAPSSADKPSDSEKPKEDPAIKGLKWRQVGPFRGGRVIAVAGVVGQPFTFYFGGVGGGVWKTTDAGLNWSPVADKEQIGGVG